MKEVGASLTLIVKKGNSHDPFYGDPAMWSFLDKHLKAR
jgi:hypothetical protein